MAKIGTQDKVRARAIKKRILELAKNFDNADLGDRADRLGPELTKTVRALAALEHWTE